MLSAKQKMVAGQLYDPADPELAADRAKAQRLCAELTGAPLEDRQRLLKDLLAPSQSFAITPPFHCDYGYNIRLAPGAYLNFNCIFLDVCAIVIGSNTLLGPGVHIYTATHPMSAVERRRGLESGRPVAVGNDVWIGGGTIICPGVSIGDRGVIGAGSVVTRDVPAGVFAAGNPCRVIRIIEPDASGAA